MFAGTEKNKLIAQVKQESCKLRKPPFFGGNSNFCNGTPLQKLFQLSLTPVDEFWMINDRKGERANGHSLLESWVTPKY